MDTQQRYDLTWQVTPDLLGVLSASGMFEATNPAWFATLGYTAEEIESRQFFDFIHPEDIERTEQAFADIQTGKPILNFRNRYRHKDGGYRWLSWNCVPEGGKFYCGARDVTDHVDDRAALRSSNDEARLREQFIAVLGHDLRNPLAALGSALTILEREGQSERGTMVIESGRKSLQRMERLIDDLMDFARARLGGGISMQVSSGEDLETTLRHVVREITDVHPDRDIQADMDLRQNIPIDSQRISQLASNLLANAVTHGDASQPIRFRAHSGDDGLTIEVENAGEEIGADIREHLFEPFVREEARPSQEGLGLGLFIASEIAKAHGGTMRVESSPEMTRFAFRMPMPA